ncbi:MAG TPA: HAD family phosphatase [Paracoccaceae bacterium]
MTHAFDAVIFDLDGTLIDTESLALASGVAAFASLGITITSDYLHQFVGVDDASNRRIMARHHPGLDLRVLEDRMQVEFFRRIDEDLPLKPGALELLAALALPKALTTSSTRISAQRKLARIGLADAFAQVITRDDVTAPKPAPEPYLLTAERLGVSPARCVVFEDSETGAAAARAAGMCVVQVPDFLPTDGRHAHHVAPSLLEGARAVGLIRDRACES